MGYQALLFCPDEKTARTVTQVLNELEFNVEACIEPFAAVKKLMGEHFDAVVVDCDNEQNATLLFKSARNSTSNQTSLAVAVVEGQAGVAKAFRIGANLVLTKPINIEQAKGTLRVARGLLRKGEPGKPGVPAAAPAAQAAAPAPTKPAAKPVSTAKPAAPAPQATPAAREIPAPKPASTPAWPAAAAASATQAPKPSNLPPVPKPAPVPAVASIPEPPAPRVEAPTFAKAPEAPAIGLPSHANAFSSAGAASAPAPAREPEISKAPEVPVASAVEIPQAAAPASHAAASIGAAPTFGYGGSAEPASSGPNKKIFIGVAAAVVIVAAAYFGWASRGHNAGTAATPATTQSAPATSQSVQSPASQAAGPVETGAVSSPSNASTDSEAAARESSKPAASVTRPSTNSAPAKTSVKEKATKEEAPEEADTTPEAAPLMVKGGKAPEKPKSANAEVSAPSMIGMATPASAPPPDLVPTTTSEFKPKLQTMSVSQGVSQGLLYKKVAPLYPASAIRLRIEGTVELLATISKNGDITQVKVVSGDSQLSKAAADAVKQWKYKPYLLNGEPVEIQTQVTIKFKLPN